jgi:hypothetical protein
MYHQIKQQGREGVTLTQTSFISEVWANHPIDSNCRLSSSDQLHDSMNKANDKVFDDKNSSILQVIYRVIGTLRLWSSLQRPQDRDLYMEVCARLEATARDTFSQHGWPHSLRIGAF